MFITGCWKWEWSYVGSGVHRGPGMYLVLCKQKLLPVRPVTPSVMILYSLTGPSGAPDS